MLSDSARNNQGVALLITLLVMTLLVAVVLELNKRVRFTVESAALSRDRLTLTEMCSSGIHAAMVLLIQDKQASQNDTIQEDWADPEKIADLVAAIPFEAGRISLAISDELGKIQINSLVKFPEGREIDPLQQQVWDNFLNALDPMEDMPEDSTPVAVVNSLKDWLDSGDDDMVTGLSGAESDYYLGLNPPYECKNGPLTDLGELFLVKGFTPDLIKRMGGPSGIYNYLTVYGASEINTQAFAFEGKININTAEFEVIAALLPPQNEEIAQQIYDFRQEKSETEYVNMLEDKWYLNCPGCRDSGINESLIRFDSDYFRIECVAVLNEIEMKTTAIVHRDADKNGSVRCRTISWQTE